MKTILVQDGHGNVMDWTVVNDDVPQAQIDALAEQTARCGLVVTVQGEPPTIADLIEAYRQEGDELEKFTAASGFSEDRCRFCGEHLGYGAKEFHVGVCDRAECRKAAAEKA